MSRRTSIAIPALVLITALASLAHAQRRGPPSPPPEALAACEDRDDGDACSVRLGGRVVEGTCMAPPGRELACMPERGSMPPPPDGEGGGPDEEHGAPPAEALSACADLAAGASCTVEGHDFTGECHAPPGRPLACVPPHHGMLPEALEACEDVALGDLCALDTPHGLVEGACRATPEGTMCVLPPPRRTSSTSAT